MQDVLVITLYNNGGKKDGDKSSLFLGSFMVEYKNHIYFFLQLSNFE